MSETTEAPKLGRSTTRPRRKLQSAQNESEKITTNDWQSREKIEQRVKIEKIRSDKGKEINKVKRLFP